MAKHFLQKFGTSMGTRMAPPYANLFMYTKESKIIQAFITFLLFWKRLIDDIFFVFIGSEPELTLLQTQMNESHPNIKYTFTSSKTHIPFLDMVVYINNERKLCTK